MAKLKKDASRKAASEQAPARKAAPAKKAPAKNAALEAWYAKTAGEDEMDGFRLLSRKEVAALPWKSGYWKHLDIARLLDARGIGLLPFATDDNSNLLAVYLNGPLEGRVAFVDHEDQRLRVAVRSVDLVRTEFERGNRFARYGADFEAASASPTEAERADDERSFQRLVAFAEAADALAPAAQEWIAAELQRLTREGAEDATRATLRKLKLPVFEQPNDVPALIRRKDFKRARALIEGGAEVTEEVLELAVRSAPPSFVTLLAEASTPARLGTLLPLAGLLGRAEVITVLLDRGVDIETVDEEGATALARAFFACSDEAVAVLLERGARGFGTARRFSSYFKKENVAFTRKYADKLDWRELSTWVDSQGIHLLTSTVQADDADALQEFLAAGADAGADPKALGVAVGRCNLACARLLDAAGATVELPYDLAWGLVSGAINAEANDATRAALVRLCHARGVRFPESVPKDKEAFYRGHTPGQLLRSAAERGYENTCLALLAAGFPHEGENNGETALNYAAWNGLTRLVAALIERGMPASPEALCYAASAGHQNVVEQFLRADPTLLNASTEKDGETALIGAAEQGRLEVVLFLLAHGADKALAKKDGKTALDLARTKDHEAVVELLEE